MSERQVPILVQGLLSEEVVLAAKFYDQRTFSAFQLPLRTRIVVGVERGGVDRTQVMDIRLSESDSFAEEVGQDVFDAALAASSQSHQASTNSGTSKYHGRTCIIIMIIIILIVINQHHKRCHVA